jgi:predicted ATP-dependent endonuclease of OLD family
VKISQLSIENFRGLRTAHLLLPDHAVLIGDNNTGKSTVLEALDLVLGPDVFRGYRPSTSMIFSSVGICMPRPHRTPHQAKPQLDRLRSL